MIKAELWEYALKEETPDYKLVFYKMILNPNGSECLFEDENAKVEFNAFLFVTKGRLVIWESEILMYYEYNEMDVLNMVSYETSKETIQKDFERIIKFIVNQDGKFKINKVEYEKHL